MPGLLLVCLTRPVVGGPESAESGLEGEQAAADVLGLAWSGAARSALGVHRGASCLQ